MLNFLATRIAQLIPTLFFVSILIFSLQHLMPGDPALVMAGEERDPEVIAQIRQQYGSIGRCRCNTSTGSRACCPAISGVAAHQVPVRS